MQLNGNLPIRNQCVHKVIVNYLEADLFLWGSYGYGLDVIAPELPERVLAPLGAQKANLDPYIKDLFMQFGLQEVRHVRIRERFNHPPARRKLKGAIGVKYSFPRPLLNLDKYNFAMIMDRAIGRKLHPPLDPYSNSINYLLSAYVISYLGMTTYTGGSADVLGSTDKLVVPYGITAAEFTAAISNLRNTLSHEFVDEGVVVPKQLGAEGQITGNVIAGDVDSAAISATPANSSPPST
uniref:Desiccation-related protein PCC13-62 n=1 Tax=Physcomitrium patens TaxID=3218 RepID=A0A2K1J9V6_PHYPA|nr:hypothetical protein PHYPA_021431 [Physcomitrium patens]